MNNIQQDILNKIKSGEVDMKPKWHFVLKAGLAISGLMIATLLMVYILSFALFFMHQNGIWLGLGFGFKGISFFVMSSPWLLVGASVAFMAMLYILVKKYSFSYRQPLLYSMLAVVVLALFGSAAIHQTTIHQQVGGFMDRNQVPFLGSMYHQAINERPEGVSVGTIEGLTEQGFILKSDQGETLSVTINQQTRMRPGMEIKEGDVMIVFGDRKDDEVVAFGIKPFDKKRMRSLKNDGSQAGQLFKAGQKNPGLNKPGTGRGLNSKS